MFVQKLWGTETIDYDSKIYNFYVQKQYSDVSNEKPNDDYRQTTKFINFIEIIKKQRNPTYVNALNEIPLRPTCSVFRSPFTSQLLLSTRWRCQRCHLFISQC